MVDPVGKVSNIVRRWSHRLLSEAIVQGRVGLDALEQRLRRTSPSSPRVPLQAASVEWAHGERPALCPVCTLPGPKRLELRAVSPFAAQGTLDYVHCPRCEAFFVPHFPPPPYAQLPASAVQLYVEQAAGVDVMLEPLFAVPRERVRRFLDVGCGYGFTVDFAQHSLGWEARGADPSSNAAEGRRALGIDIQLAPWTGESEEPVDLLFSSEVIEHLPHPPGFLANAARGLGERGILLLTTPNAARIERAGPDFPTVAILSVGYHCVLFTRKTLAHALADAGFSDVRIWERDFTLLAMASRGPLPPPQPPVLDRALYRRYLEARLARVPPATTLSTGLAYRLFKEQVNAADYLQAERHRPRLLVDIARRFAIDAGDPAVLDRVDLAALNPVDFHQHLPFNLCGCLYFQGMLELNHHGDAPRAAAFFAAAQRASRQIRTVLQQAGADDGETEDLGRQAQRHEQLACARFS